MIIHPCRARLRPEIVITGKVAAIYEYPADTTRAVLNRIAGDDHIVFGSDYPHSPAKVIAAKKQHFDANPDLNVIRLRICRDNGIALLNRKK